MTDERHGQPSLSSLKRIANCPPSFKLEKQIKSEEVSVDALFGTECHTAMETKDDSKLSDEQKFAVDRARDLEDLLIIDLIPDNAKLTETREDRLWAYAGAISGKPDRIVYWNDSALIIDYKFGRITADHPKNNYQLLGLALLLRQNHPMIKNIEVAIIQPLTEYENRQLHYSVTEDDIEKFHNIVSETLEKIDSDTGKKNPSLKTCEYCRAKSICNEAQESALVVQNFDSSALTVDTIQSYLDLAALAEKALSARVKEIRSKALQLLSDDPDCIPNYSLIEGRKSRTIEDVESAFQKLSDENLIGKDEMMKSVSIKMTELEKQVSERNSISKRVARQLLENNLADLITTKQTASYVRRR